MSSKVKIYPVALLLVVSFVTLWAKDQKSKEVDKSGEKSLKPEKRKQYSERDMKAWALGCAAMLTERSYGWHDSLTPYQINERSIEKWKEILNEWWGTNSRADLFDSLRWIDNGGHRLSFDKLGSYVSSLSEDQCKQLLEKNKGDQEILQKIRIAKKYYKELGEKSLFGWDYSRYICLCRWGYLIGYISEEEAWAKIMPVARMLRNKFDSWRDLGQNYIIGRQFWSYKQTEAEGYLFEDAYQRLLDMPSSPWNKYPWDIDLSGTKSVSEPREKDRAERSNNK
jgi:hypothetical protein